MVDTSILVDLDLLGLNGAILLAGFSGGVCYIALQPMKPSAWSTVSGLLVATLTANYLSGVTAKYIGTYALPSAFVTGLCATWICKAIIKRAQAWSPSNGKERTNGT